MKLNEMALANALALATGAVYVFCRLFIALFPDLSLAISQSWFHALDLSTIWDTSITTAGTFVLGLVSTVVLAWASGWVFAWLYNRFAK